MSNASICLDVEDYGTTPGSTVWVYTCHPEDTTPAHQNQRWSFAASGAYGALISPLSGLAATAVGEVIQNGTPILLEAAGSPGSQWRYNTTDKTIRGPGVGFCLDAGAVGGGPCTTEPAASMPFCDWHLPLTDRVANLVGNLTQREKIGLFGNSASGVARLGIAGYQWWSEALHGVANSPGVHFGDTVPFATSFPQIIATACSFNTTLFHAVSSSIGLEARAMNNAGHAGLTFWAPNINIVRDPRWGRGQVGHVWADGACVLCVVLCCVLCVCVCVCARYTV